METISASYLTRAELWLFITTLIYFLMNGAQIFETAVLVPKWASSPPHSFGVLADKNGAPLKMFWIVFHSLHEVTFILAIIFCWKLDPIRNWLLVLFIVHFAVRVWTILYFAPNIIQFQKLAEIQSITKNLTDRVLLWQNLNYLRVGAFLAISIGLVPLCIRLFNFKM